METLAKRVAGAIAEAIGGSFERLATQGERAEFIVRLADGNAPVLVQNHGHAVSVYVHGRFKRTCRATEPFDAVVREVAGSALAWSRREAGPSLFGLVPEMTALLSEAFGEPWTAHLSGGSVPEEAWFHGPNFDAGSVGIVQMRVSITIAGELLLLPISSMSDWLDARAPIVEGVRAQRTAYDEFVALSRRLLLIAEELRTRLTTQLGGDIVLTQHMRPTHHSGARCRLDSGGSVLAELEVCDGAVMLSTGAPGDAGWRGAVDELDTVWPQVLASLERARSLLDLESLRPGERYRVLETIQGLSHGTIVVFRGFEDIDNHFGSYDFEDMGSGKKVTVTGDFSSPGRHPFAATYRYLEHSR